MPRPSGSIGAMSAIRCFWSTCNQPHRTWSSGSTSDEAPALRSFFNTAVEAEEQEDVARADALLVQVPLCDAGLAEHSSPLLPSGAAFPVSVRFEVEVRVEMDSVPSVQAPVGDAGDNAGDVDVAVVKGIEPFTVSGRDGQREYGAVGEDGAGTAT